MEEERGTNTVYHKGQWRTWMGDCWTPEHTFQDEVKHRIDNDLSFDKERAPMNRETIDRSCDSNWCRRF